MAEQHECEWAVDHQILPDVVEGTDIHYGECFAYCACGEELRCHEIQSRLNEYEKLKDELADIRESHRIVMSEECPSGEVHCTCVPILGAENEKLKRATEALSANRARQLSDDLDEAQQTPSGAVMELYHDDINAIKTYADILEGK